MIYRPGRERNYSPLIRATLCITVNSGLEMVEKCHLIVTNVRAWELFRARCTTRSIIFVLQNRVAGESSPLNGLFPGTTMACIERARVFLFELLAVGKEGMRARVVRAKLETKSLRPTISIPPNVTEPFIIYAYVYTYSCIRVCQAANRVSYTRAEQFDHNCVEESRRF